MSDFLVWMSPLPIPQNVYRRWRWDESGCLGTRRQQPAALARQKGADRDIALLGSCYGRRGRRAHTDLSELAEELLGRLDFAEATALDDYLGPFAGALVSRDGDRALIWRDRFGRWPIQMVRLSRGWAITTAPELVTSLVSPRADFDNIATFVHGDHATGTGDVLRDVFRVRPGECLVFGGGAVGAGEPQRRSWWTPRPQEVERPDEAMKELLHSMGTFLGSRPHVLALSAGLDSSTLAATISSRQSANEAVTFSDRGSFTDESLAASQTAAHLGLKWRPFWAHSHWPLARIKDHHTPLSWGPAAYPDAAWKMPFHRELRARRGALPLMYGNGSDEVLWFPSFLWLKDRWQHADLAALSMAAPHLSTSSFLRPALSVALDKTGLRTLRELLPAPSQEFSPWQRSVDWIAHRPQSESLVDGGDAQEQFLQLRVRRLQTWRWERVMRALAMESRFAEREILTPYLDAEFWELCLSLSPMQLVEGGRQKSILRRVTDDLLPEECRRRPKLGGFDPLVERGLAQQASRRVFSLFARPRLGDWPAFDGVAFLNAYEAYRRSPVGETSRRYRGSWAVWRTVATELWLRRFE